jgi:hypothetical protein
MTDVEKLISTLIDILTPVKRISKIEPWVVLHCDDLNEVEEAIRDREFMHNHIIRGAKKLLRNRSTTELCVEIRCASNYTSIWISVTTNDVLDSLAKILRRYEEAEEYEECADILRLINRIKARMNETVSNP